MAGYSLHSVVYRKAKSVKRLRTEKSDFWKDLKSVCIELAEMSHTRGSSTYVCGNQV